MRRSHGEDDMSSTNPYEPPQASSRGEEQSKPNARESIFSLLPVWFIAGCFLGYVFIPEFGNPAGQANAGVGGIAGIVALVAYWHLARPRLQKRFSSNEH